MSAKIRTRMGDGELVAMSPSEIREDIAVGTRDAAGKAGIPELTDEEQERLYEIIADPSRIVSVAPGDEVIVTDDGVPGSLYCGQDDSGVGIPLSRGQATLTYERACAADTVSLGHSDYSFKPVKNVLSDETSEYYNISMDTTAPFIYGAQPNLGSYYQPDGPVRNPADLLLGGDVKAAQEAQEEAAEKMRQDILFCGRKLNDVGCEGLNLDTSASGGDADFMGTLQVVSELKEEAPGMPVIVGASGEFVLGMHGEVTFNDKQLAGMYPHDQVKVAEEAGVSIYGVAIGTSTNESLAWNVARSVTFTKAAVSAANIPIHVNVGMGVGGVPMCEVPPVDALTRATKSLVELGKADGL